MLVVEDGPTLTHGGMAYGAGMIAAEQYGAGELVDPRGCAVGSIAETLHRYPHLHDVLPALGYSEQQREELSQTIGNSNADVIIDASPARLERLLNLSIPIIRVQYRFRQVRGGPTLTGLVDNFLSETSEAI